MQAKPPLAAMAAASSDIRAASALGLRIAFIGKMIGRDGK
jgi:hypothetical protein